MDSTDRKIVKLAKKRAALNKQIESLDKEIDKLLRSKRAKQ